VGSLSALAACGRKDDARSGTPSTRAAQAESVAAVMTKVDPRGSGGGGHLFGPPTGQIRVANLLELGGKPSGPLDFYDTRTPDSSARPLIANLAFGQISDYVSPRAADASPGSPSNLYSFPAGTKKPSPPFGDRIDNQGFAATDQITVALGPANMGGVPSIALPAIDEAGKRVNAFRDSSRVFPAGKGLLIMLQGDANLDSLPAMYLSVDGVCPLNANDSRNTHPTAIGSDLNLIVSASVHTLAIVTSPRGQGLSDCSGKKPGEPLFLTVGPGQRYVIFVYGLPSDGFKVGAAQLVPITP
jgi:hypothetical protein